MVNGVEKRKEEIWRSSHACWSVEIWLGAEQSPRDNADAAGSGAAAYGYIYV
jgi:hypothetical protein